LRYSPPLDGVRAIAILAVVIFHVSPDFLPGGFTGVDVFFVLSGFLLGSIILEQLDAGSFSLREFYARRIRRLAPNLILTVFGVVLLWRLFLPPSAAREAARHGLWTLANLSNFFVWRNFRGYWGEGTEWAPLLHTWSLAVEEQFYLFFPALLLVLARFQRRHVRLWLLVIALASLAACIRLTPGHPSAAFYMLPTRLWQLLLGASIIGMPRLPSAVGELAGWSGLALMAGGFIWIGDRGFPGYLALVPVIGAMLVIVSILSESTIATILALPAFVRTGKLSYSLYLWHWPLIILGRLEAQVHGVPPLAGAIAGAALSLATATAAYLLIEQPVRSQRRFAPVGAAFASCLLAAAAIDRYTPHIDTTRYFDSTAYYGRLYSAGRVSNDLASSVRFRDVRFPVPEQNSHDEAWRSGGIVHYFGGPAPAVVVLGSSHALMYARTIDHLCERLRISVAFLAVDGASIFSEIATTESFPTVAECVQFLDARREWLTLWHPRAILLIERWDNYSKNPEEFEFRLQRLLQEMSPLAERVFFVAQPPVIAQIGNTFNLREWAAWRSDASGRMPRFLPDANEASRQSSVEVAEQSAAKFPNLRVLRPDRNLYESDGAIRWLRGRTVLYADDDHLSDAGAESVGEVFESALTPLARQNRSSGQQ
jgi:peptidoglycan/LPS O-acetylase OafA/YrhL